MNIHHLELFYHVGRSGGISRAVRHIPYGIQQPAVSSQILLLEQDLGVKLFNRQPFKLTEEGELLFSFIRDFFGNLDETAAMLRHRTAPLLRIGASELMLRDYLPHIIQRLALSHPQLRLGLRSGYQSQLEDMLLDSTIDFAVVTSAPDGRKPQGLQGVRLMRLPLVLLVNRKSKIRSAAQLWSMDRIEEALICLPAGERISQIFQKGLKGLGVDWAPSIEASSLELITRYVANGYGIGVNVNIAESVKHPKVRVLPLEGIEPVEIVALWKGTPTPIIRTLVAQVQGFVKQAWPQWCCEDSLPPQRRARAGAPVGPR